METLLKDLSLKIKDGHVVARCGDFFVVIGNVSRCLESGGIVDIKSVISNESNSGADNSDEVYEEKEELETNGEYEQDDNNNPSTLKKYEEHLTALMSLYAYESAETEEKDTFDIDDDDETFGEMEEELSTSDYTMRESESMSVKKEDEEGLDSASYKKLFFEAIETGNLDTVDRMVRVYKVDPNDPNEYGETATEIARRRNHYGIVSYLLDTCPSMYGIYVYDRMNVYNFTRSETDSKVIYENNFFAYHYVGNEGDDAIYESNCQCGARIRERKGKFCSVNPRGHTQYLGGKLVKCGFLKLVQREENPKETLDSIKVTRGIIRRSEYSLPFLRFETLQKSYQQTSSSQSSHFIPIESGLCRNYNGWKLGCGCTLINSRIRYGKVAIYDKKPQRKYGVQINFRNREMEVVDHELCRVLCESSSSSSGRSPGCVWVKVMKGVFSYYCEQNAICVGSVKEEGKTKGKLIFYGRKDGFRPPGTMSQDCDEFTVGKVVYDQEEKRAYFESLFYGYVERWDDFELLCLKRM